ncbi:hypothetical protein [Corynebacterium efficiens YS-314]|uniref:Major facilitator superfamily (MFS) profile domain-containing protein n=2 Tax=Corynebacterium efficiens TaxID=152794 RepID=Q8FQV0_COREF|nr:hypothetical protein [Corynebacterium efficiens YS-314]
MIQPPAPALPTMTAMNTDESTHRDRRDPALEEHNASRFIWSNGLQNIGDQIIAAKTVLPWLLHAGGAPGFFIALLVPIRESGSMLPQAAITPWVLWQASRSRVWIIGSNGQFLSGLGIGIAALFLEGWALGIAVVVLLGILALFRSMCSISSKDVQGKTITKGRRGLINGRATAIGGGVGLAVGLAITFLLDTDSPPWVLAATVIASSFSWLIASFIFAGIREPDTREKALPRDPEEKNRWWKDCVDLLVEDVNFRKFVIVRSLMLVTALSTAFIVTLAAEAGQDITALGFFVIASGLASMVGGRISGIWSDRSSRDVMAGGALLGSLVLFALVASAQWSPSTVNVIAFPAGFFLVNLAHTAIRVARKTYVVDMAEGDQRTRYVAAANTLMGVILLVVGAISGAVAMLGTSWALIFLAVIGLVGVVFSRTLEEVSAPQS